MDNSLGQILLSILQVMLFISIVAGIGASVLLVLTYRDIRQLNIPAGAGFFETMRVVPLRVAIFLDLMDLALDTFAAPLAWLVLRWLRLDALKAPAMLEAIIPGTQYIPTMTLVWGATRIFNLGLPAPAPFPTATRGAATSGFAPASAVGVAVIDSRVVRR